MKKIIAILAVLAMLLTAFAGCQTKKDNSGLNAAKEYLETMYKTEPAETAASYEVTAVLTIKTVKYSVEWSANVENVTIEKKNDTTYTVNVSNKTADKVDYVLTATIKDAKGNTATASFNHYIPGAAQGNNPERTYTLATELKDKDTVILYSPASGMAVSENDLSADQPGYRAGEAVTVSGNTITTTAGQIVWDVEAVDGGFKLYGDNGMTLSCTGRKLLFGDTDNVWTIRPAATANCVYVESTTGKGTSGDPYTIEWYEQDSEFSTYYYSEANENLFALQLYTLPDSADIKPVTPPDPSNNPTEDPSVDPANGVEFTLTTTVKDGDQIIIYNAGSGMALSEENLSEQYTNYRKGVKMTLSNGKLITKNSLVVWTVKTVSGGIQLVSDDGKTLSATERRLPLADTDNIWTVKTATTANSVYFENNTVKGDQGDSVCIEWYDQYNEFSSFYYNTSKESIFAMQIYVAPAGAVIKPSDDPVDPPVNPSTGDTYTLSTTLKDGDQVVIYNAAGMALSEADASLADYRAGEAVTVTDGKIVTTNSKIVWTVKAVTGGYQFVGDNGQTLSCTGRTLKFGDADNVWTLRTATTANSVYLESTTGKGQQGDPYAIEWYADKENYSTFYYKDTMENLFALQLYVLSK